jgi:PKD repeat protein
MKKISTLIILILLLTTTSTNAQLTWQWGVRGNDNGPNNSSHEDNVIDMASDPNGNVYTLTRVYYSGDIAGMPVNGYTNVLNIIETIVVTSFDCNGQYRWHKRIGGSAGNNHGVAIKTDTLGGVYITGRVLAYAFHPDQVNFPDSLHIDIDSSSAFTSKSLFIVKYDTAGDYQWLRMPQPDTVSYITSLSKTGSVDMDVAPNGDVYVYSQLAPGLYEDGAFEIMNHQFYVIRYNKDGVFQNVIPLDMTYTNAGDPNNGDGSFNPIGAHFKRDHNNGHFYLSGIFWGYAGTWSIGNTPLVYTGGYAQKMYVGSFDGSGNALWVRQTTAEDTGTFGSASYTRSRVAIDDDGNVFVAGFAFNGDSWYGHTFTNPFNATGIFLLKLDVNGNTEWISAPSITAGEALEVVHSNGVIGLAGLYGHMVWDGFEIENPLGTGRDVFLARFSSGTGAVIGVDTIESYINAQEWLTAMTADKSGNFSIGGVFRDELYVPGNTLVQMNNEDWFVAKLGTGDCGCTLAVPDLSYTTGIGTAMIFTYTGTTPVDSVTWDFGDGNNAIGNNVNHTYSVAGTYTVCATAYNSCGMSIHCETFNTNGVGIENIQAIADIRIYPNPAVQDITIENSQSGTTMEIYNMTGSLVLHTSLQSTREKVNISDIPTGIYMIRFTDKDQRQTSMKFLKQ